jgi:hypothetical protein
MTPHNSHFGDLTNYKLKDGDTVELLNPVKVDGYVFCEATMTRGSWGKLTMLTGSSGVCIRARTPRVWAKPGESLYFANVDIPYMGEIHRVRVKHNELRRISK